ncbi:hypothetical protein Csa_022023, partial [Cucumis sativus]
AKPSSRSNETYKNPNQFRARNPNLSVDGWPINSPFHLIQNIIVVSFFFSIFYLWNRMLHTFLFSLFIFIFNSHLFSS